MNVGNHSTPFLILAIDTGSSDSSSKQNLYLYPGDDVKMKAVEFCATYNLSNEAVPIIVNHVKSVLDQHQKKLDDINSTPSWQQSSMARIDDSKLAQAQSEGEKRESCYNPKMQRNIDLHSPSSLFESSDKKPSRMATINEDLLESQQNSSAKKTRNNEDLKDVAEFGSPNPQNSSEMSSMTNILGSKGPGSSVKSARHSARKNIGSRIAKKTKKIDHTRSSQDWIASPTDNYLKAFKKSIKTTRAYKTKKSKTRKKANIVKKGLPFGSLKKFSVNYDSKDISYQGASCENVFQRQVNKRRKSRQSLVNKYKKRNNSVTCSFKPTINSHSKFIIEDKSYRSLERDYSDKDVSQNGSQTCKNAYDKNITKQRIIGKVYKENIPTNQKKNIERECTFKPKLNKLSRKIVKSIRGDSLSSRKSGSGSRTSKEIFNKLYEDSKEHKKRLELMTKKAQKSSPNFKPEISTSRTTKSKDNNKRSFLCPKQFEKFRKEGCKSRYGMAKPFHKHTNIRNKRSPSGSNSRSISKTINDLFIKDSRVNTSRIINGECKRIYQDSKIKFTKYLNRKRTAHPTTHQRSKSSKIMQKIRAKRCKELFDKLDSDKDGLISSEKIDILQVSNEIIDIITPFLLEIEDKQLELDYSQFYTMIIQFGKSLNIDEKNALFGRARAVNRNTDATSTFLYPSESHTLDSHKGLSNTSHKNITAEKPKEKESYKRPLNMEKVARELKKCSSKPSILEYSSRNRKINKFFTGARKKFKM
ncbi:unnamed protein product [Moneuplotes crassus]|uniref:EF-hand domain-containing protein n=1 Tax=Euplotes crassus TaxID=5936 RepID=A0AAD1Y6E1_EUPCR|nr:unnamed protein product [Moneuplotes crassus]